MRVSLPVFFSIRERESENRKTNQEEERRISWEKSVRFLGASVERTIAARPIIESPVEQDNRQNFNFGTGFGHADGTGSGRL
jgi:hypothetical protein